MCKLLLKIGLLGLIGAIGGAAEDSVTAVCRVLSNLQLYRGKMVSVIGVLIGGPEGLYLVPSKTDSCQKSVLFGEYEWPNPSFNLAAPGSPFVEFPLLAPHRHESVGDVPSDSKGERWVIVTGRVEAREHLQMVTVGSDDQAKQIPYGYGHLNRSPAQIVYARIRQADSSDLVKREHAK